VERATTAPHPAAPSHAHVVAPPRVVGFISREHSARATALRATRRGRSAPPAPSSVHVEAAHVSMLRNTREMLMPDISMLRNTREMLMPDISMLRNTREVLIPDSEAAVFGDGYAPASAMDVTSSNAVRVSQ
jgi:pyridoxine 5'-phosphate synthase PdxJ